MVELIDVRMTTASDEDAACLRPPEEYGFAWILTNARPVRQIAVKGRLGLYSDDELVDRI